MPLPQPDPLSAIAGLRYADTPRTRRYRAALDAELERLLAANGDAHPGSAWQAEGDPRTVTAGVGYLAFHYACPGLRHQGDPRLLHGVRVMLADILACQLPTGELSCTGTAGVERPGPWPPHPHSSHGQSWYLEPLLYALTWLAPHLEAGEKERYDRQLYRTADFIAARPIDETNNRGVIVCAVLALCANYFGEPRYRDLARTWFHRRPSQVFDPRSGQILEGSGPDGNYSGTTYEYLYQYALHAADPAVDAPMLAALKWYARVMDPNGHQLFQGASTRMPEGHSPTKISDILPALERYSATEPFLQRLIEQYLPLCERGSLGRPFHSICPAIWALLEHQPIAAPAAAPAWYTDPRTWYHTTATGPEHLAYNEGYDCLYFPYRQAYTTLVTVRGRAPYQDLQGWTWRDEPPVIYPSDGQASATRAWGVDTAEHSASGLKYPDFCWVDGAVPGLIVRWGPLYRFYVFTARTTLIIGAGATGPLAVDWVVTPAICGEPVLGDGALTYAGRQGRLLWRGGSPDVTSGSSWRRYRFHYPDAPVVFALSDATFAWGEEGADSLTCRDAAGAYRIAWTVPAEPPGNFPHRARHLLRISPAS